MSLLDDARRLADPYAVPEDGPGICWWCGEPAMWIGGGHAPDCPWLSMPRIVAALEAAEGIARISDRKHEAWLAFWEAFGA